MENQPVWLLQRIINHDTNPIIIKEGLYKIGRSPESNIFCKSEWVSRFHCDVTVRGGNVYIKDLGSLNGTYIEQTEILKERDLQLKNGDIISLGKPFMGDMPENGHYVYRLVACNEPPEPKKRKRIASSSPENEEQSVGVCSPKRIKESTERVSKQIKDPPMKPQVSTKKQEKVLEKSAICDKKRNSLPLRNSVSINQVSSSAKDMECIDLTDDDNEKIIPVKPSIRESLTKQECISPDSSDCKNQFLSILNSSSLNPQDEFLRAIMTWLKNHKNDIVLKDIETHSGEVKREENASNKISVHNQSIAGSSSSNIVSSNFSISTRDEHNLSQPAEVTNSCSARNNMKIKSDIKVNSVQPICKNNEHLFHSEVANISNVSQCSSIEPEKRFKSEYANQSKVEYENQFEIGQDNQFKIKNKNQSETEQKKEFILKNENRSEVEEKKEFKVKNDNQSEAEQIKEIKVKNDDQRKAELDKAFCSHKADLIQPPKDLTHSSGSVSSNIGSKCTLIQSDLNSPNKETESIPDEEQNYKPQLKKSRSDSLTLEMDKLDSLLQGTYKPFDYNEKILADNKINNKYESKQKGNNESFVDSLDSKQDNKTGVDDIDTFHKSINTTCDKNNENASVSRLINNTTINMEQQPLFSGEDQEEVEIDPLSRNKLENNLEEVIMNFPPRNEPEDSPSTSKAFGAEGNSLIRIKQEPSSEQIDIDEHLVFSQDIDGVVVIDESEDELEYSQMFLEQEVPEVAKEVLDEKTNVCIKEEFLFEDNDENEEIDLFQSHFSQCSQEQEEWVQAETSKKKKTKSKSHLINDDTSSQQQTEVVKSPRSRQKHVIRDLSIKLKKLDSELLTEGEKKNLESNLKAVEADYPDQMPAVDSLQVNKIINVDTFEIIKCNYECPVDLESLDILKKSSSNEVIESDKNPSSSITIEKDEPVVEQAANKAEQSRKKKESATKRKSKRTGSRKSSVGSNRINRSESGKDVVDAICNKKLELEKSVSAVGSKTIEPDENCPPSNLIKKAPVTPEIGGPASEIVSLPPPESISGAKLVKSTLLCKPPSETTVRRKPGRPKKVESSVTRDALNKERQKKLIEDRKAKLKSIALEANSKIIDNGDKNNTNCEIIPRTEKVSKKRKVDEGSPPSISSQSKDDKLLADKSVIKSGSPDKRSSIPTKSIGVAKITERNRGSILLEGLLEDPYRKTRTRKKIEKANCAMKSTESLPPVTKKSPSDDTEKDKEKPSCTAGLIAPLPKTPSNGLKSCLKIVGQRSSVKKVEFNLKRDVKVFECEGTLRPINSMGLKDKAPSTQIPQPLATLTIPVITTLEETYFDIVHWNAAWTKEIKIIPGEPPVYIEKYNCKDSYVSYKDYKRWLYPLMLYELWANMCKTMNDEDTNNTGRVFDGIVLETLQYGIQPSNGKNLLVLKCFFPLYGKQTQNMVDAMDILMIKALSAFEGKRILFLMFGLVYSTVKMISYRETSDPVARHYLTTLNQKPDACAYFDVIIYKSQQKQVTTGFQLKIRPAYNMMTELREFESLIKLASSPLSDIIIDPVTNSSVYLQKDMNNKIVTQYPLNEEQRKAILCTSQSVFANKPSISLIHGPPGTGKTQVIVSLVEQLLNRFKLKSNYKRKKILICSHSNNAIDEICLRLLEVRQQLPREKRFKLTRYGRKDKMHPRVAEIETSTLARKEVEKRNFNDDLNLELSLKKATERMVATALENPASPKAESYKRRYAQIQTRIKCLEALINNKDSNKETRHKEFERMVFEEEMKVIYHSDIIATTLGSCTQKRITKAFSEMSKTDEDKRGVGVCIIDEATQATEADSLLPLVYDVKNLILVGDPQQLPPFVASQTAKQFGLCQSLFSRLYKVWSGQPSAPVYMLTAQHRMHPEIAKFPSRAFYNGQLTTPSFLEIKRPFRPYAIIMHTHSQDSSETNIGEAKLIVEMAEKLLLEPAMKGLSIGLIAPYQRQRSLIMDLFLDKKVLKQLSVNTIDSYQGQERDVILLSVVRTSGIGFLNDQQRLNVALTRAKKALYVVGNFTSLQTTDIWKELLVDARERNIQFDAGRAEKLEDIFGFLFERNCKKTRTSNS